MRRSRILTSRFRERVYVTTKDGGTFSGVLYSCDHVALVLRDAEALATSPTSRNVPIDGEVIILFADVSYLQRP